MTKTRTGNVSVNSNQFLDIRPPSGEEWVIRNIYHDADCELYVSNGTNDIGPIDYGYGRGAWLGVAFVLNNGHFLRVKNVSTSAARFGYDGVVIT